VGLRTQEESATANWYLEKRSFGLFSGARIREGASRAYPPSWDEENIVLKKDLKTPAVREIDKKYRSWTRGGDQRIKSRDLGGEGKGSTRTGSTDKNAG